jgi:hypothetical protein
VIAVAGEVRLDHLDEPALVRCEAVPVEQPLEVGEQEATCAGELHELSVPESDFDDLWSRIADQ